MATLTVTLPTFANYKEGDTLAIGAPTVSGGAGTGQVFTLIDAVSQKSVKPPTGWVFSSTTGAITGVAPTRQGIYGVAIRVVDSANNIGQSIPFTIPIDVTAPSDLAAGILAGAGLGPATAAFAVGATAGTLVATITGLNSGEIVTGIAPNDGRLAIGGSGTTLVVGLTATSAGVTTYSYTTNQGRSQTVAVTAGAGLYDSTLNAFITDSLFGGAPVTDSLLGV